MNSSSPLQRDDDVIYRILQEEENPLVKDDGGEDDVKSSQNSMNMNSSLVLSNKTNSNNLISDLRPLINAISIFQLIKPNNQIPWHVFKERFNYASASCSAHVLDTSQGCQHTSALLNDNLDQSMLSYCEANFNDNDDHHHDKIFLNSFHDEGLNLKHVFKVINYHEELKRNQKGFGSKLHLNSQKYIILQLCAEIKIDTVVLGNFEYFSSNFKHFSIWISDKYPPKENLHTTFPFFEDDPHRFDLSLLASQCYDSKIQQCVFFKKGWRLIGHFEASNARGPQIFSIPNSQGFSKYVRFEFHSHYGKEIFCPITLIQLYGSTMIEDFKNYEDEVKEKNSLKSDRSMDYSYPQITRAAQSQLPLVVHNQLTSSGTFPGNNKSDATKSDPLLDLEKYHHSGDPVLSESHLNSQESTDEQANLTEKKELTILGRKSGDFLKRALNSLCSYRQNWQYNLFSYNNNNNNEVSAYQVCPLYDQPGHASYKYDENDGDDSFEDSIDNENDIYISNSERREQPYSRHHDNIYKSIMDRLKVLEYNYTQSKLFLLKQESKLRDLNKKFKASLSSSSVISSPLKKTKPIQEYYLENEKKLLDLTQLWNIEHSKLEVKINQNNQQQQTQILLLWVVIIIQLFFFVIFCFNRSTVRKFYSIIVSILLIFKRCLNFVWQSVLGEFFTLIDRTGGKSVDTQYMYVTSFNSPTIELSNSENESIINNEMDDLLMKPGMEDLDEPDVYQNVGFSINSTLTSPVSHPAEQKFENNSDISIIQRVEEYTNGNDDRSILTITQVHSERILNDTNANGVKYAQDSLSSRRYSVPMVSSITQNTNECGSTSSVGKLDVIPNSVINNGGWIVSKSRKKKHTHQKSINL